MNAKDFLQFESDRCEAYKLLSACYYLPDENTLEKLEKLEIVLNCVCPASVKHVAQMKDEIDLALLRVDFSRLFVGPFRLLAPPYGSVYLEGKREVMGVSTIDVKNRYTSVGLEISGQIKEAPDHIAIELEFMYYLIFKEINSIEQSDLGRVRDYLRQQQQFLKIHLGAWLPEFVLAAQKNATTDFYKNLVQATKIFIQQDLGYTAELLTGEKMQQITETTLFTV